MSNLNDKVISSNFQKLLQITHSTNAVLDGTGSAFGLRMSGSSIAINTAPADGIDLAVAGTISASIISASTGVFGANTVRIGGISLSENEDGGIRFQDSSSVELGAFAGPGFFVLTSSLEEHGGGRPLFSLTQQVGSNPNENVGQITTTGIKGAQSNVDFEYKFGIQPSASSQAGDFFISIEPGIFTANPNPNSARNKPSFYVTQSGRRIGMGMYPNNENMLSIGGGSGTGSQQGGGLFVSGSDVGHITASGNIKAGGTITADNYGGNISGSLTSTGSFGTLQLEGANFSSASIAAAIAGADNLGNHTATQDLSLGGNDIFNIQHITASGNISASAITASGITVNKISLNEDLSGSLEIKNATNQGAIETAIFKNNKEMITFDGLIGNDPLKVTINKENENLDFKVGGTIDDRLLQTDASENVVVFADSASSKVGIGDFLGNSASESFGAEKFKVVGDSFFKGIVSASGDILAPNSTGSVGRLIVGGGHFTSASLAAAVAGTDNLGNHTATQDLNLGNNDIFAVSNITASGNISASGNFTTLLTGSFGAVEATTVNTDDITVANSITHDSDSDTKIFFASDTIAMQAGNTTFITALETTQDILTLGDGNDVDIRLRGSGSATALFVESTTNQVSIGGSSPRAQLDVRGTISSSGEITVNGKTYLSSNGDITSAGAISMSNSAQSHILGGDLTVGDDLTVSDDLTVGDNITFSGSLSGSYTTTGSFGRLDLSDGGIIAPGASEIASVTINSFGMTPTSSNVSIGGGANPFMSITAKSLHIKEGLASLNQISASGFSVSSSGEVSCNDLHVTGAIESTGNTVFGNHATNDTHTFTGPVEVSHLNVTGSKGAGTSPAGKGNITASGVIKTTFPGENSFSGSISAGSTIKTLGSVSASATVFADKYESKGTFIAGLTNGVQNFGHTSFNNSYHGLVHSFTGSMRMTGSITAHSIGPGRMDGSTDSRIEFALPNSFDDGTFKFISATRELFRISESAHVIVGDGGDVDFQVRTNGDDNAIFVLGSTDNVGIGTATPTSKLQVSGDITATNITASGNISSSGTIISNATNTIGNITASGNISASGDIFADDITVTDMVQGGRLSSLGNITASGNISASGIITGEGLVISDDALITDDLEVQGNISGSSITASTDFKIGGTVITDGQIADDGNLTMDLAGDLAINVDGGDVSILDNTTHIANINRTQVSGSALSTGSFGAGFFNNKVGIGTTSPGQHLEVVGNISASGDIFADRVGIGILGTSPGEALEVVGNISASGVGDFGSLDVNGDVDIDGTTQLDNTVITGSLKLSGEVNIAGSGQGHITASGNAHVGGKISATGDLLISGDKVDFTSLPTSSAGANTKGLFTQLGSEILGSGSAGSDERVKFNNFSASKFVLIKE